MSGGREGRGVRGGGGRAGLGRGAGRAGGWMGAGSIHVSIRDADAHMTWKSTACWF